MDISTSDDGNDSNNDCFYFQYIHDNELIEELYTNGPVTRRLNMTWPQAIITQ
jgi:hypothetical protein